jgi:esterase/lipase
MIKLIFRNEVQYMSIAYIIVHGFGGNPKDVYSIKNNLLKYDIKENDIYLPLLYGHNTQKRGFVFGIKYTEMIEHLKDYIYEISKKYDKIIVIGYSMGALLCMCVSMKIKIDKLIVLNPPIHIWDFNSFRFWFGDDLKKRRLFHTKTVLRSIRYRVIRNNLELTRLRHFTIDNISKITADTYVIQSLHDYVANPMSGKFVYDNISSTKKGISYYKRTSHFIPNEKDLDVIMEDIYNWIQN